MKIHEINQIVFAPLNSKLKMKFQLSSLSRELEEHGLKQDDYKRLSAFCSIRLSSVRHQNGFLYRKKGKPFAYKRITSSSVTENPALSALPVYSIIRLWAKIQLLLSESRTQPRKKHHIRKLSRKVIKLIPLLPQASEEFIFALWAEGVAHFVVNDYEKARKYLNSFEAQMQTREELEMAPWKSVPTHSRFCEYQMKKTATAVTKLDLIQNPYTQASVNPEQKNEVVVVNGIAFDLSGEDAANMKAKRYAKIQNRQLFVLIKNRKCITTESIRELSKCPKLISVAGYYKAIFAASIPGGAKIAKDLYDQSVPNLKSGLQLIRIQTLPKISLLTKPAILDNQIPAKPIVYDVAFDLLQTPQLAKKSILGGWF